jgi:hypothetical protein
MERVSNSRERSIWQRDGFSACVRSRSWKGTGSAVLFQHRILTQALLGLARVTQVSRSETRIYPLAVLTTIGSEAAGVPAETVPEAFLCS